VTLLYAFVMVCSGAKACINVQDTIKRITPITSLAVLLEGVYWHGRYSRHQSRTLAWLYAISQNVAWVVKSQFK